MQENTQVQTTPPLPGPTLVDQINKALQTLGTDFSGSTDPGAAAWSYSTWADTGAGRLRRRNDAGTAWVDLGPLLAEAGTPVDGALYASQAWTLQQILARSGLPIFAPNGVPATDVGPIYVTGATSPGVWTWSGGAYVPRTPATVRQTVLSGSVNASQLPSFLGIGSGLAAVVLGASIPLRIAIAAGSDGFGAIDYVYTHAQDTAVTGLSANAVNYIFADRNPTTGAVTFGSTTIPPTYGYGGGTTAAGAHLYSIPAGRMFLGNGSSAAAVQRVFLGEVVTNASAVVSIVAYAYQGQFGGTSSAIPGGSRVTVNHNLGCVPQLARITLVCVADNLGYSVGEEVPLTSLSSGGTNPFQVISESVDRRTIGAISNSGSLALFHRSTGSWTTLTASAWQTKFYASRGW